jgi:hypothetical protein
MFARLRAAAVAFDDTARRGLGEGEMEQLRRALSVLHGNVTGGSAAEGRS